MIFHYGGKFSGEESALPQREHPEGAVPFKEVSDMAKLAMIANAGCVITMVVLAIPLFLRCEPYMAANAPWLAVGGLCSMLSLYPHEILHALCFRKDVTMFTNLSQGLMFVVGTEDMSKARFIFMSMLPNLVFGFTPYIVSMVFPNLVGLGLFGLICIGMGFGDYMNVWNALMQMPKGAKTYLCGMHSYWYLPEGAKEKKEA